MKASTFIPIPSHHPHPHPPHQTGKITLSNLKKRLGVFYKNMPNKEFRFLMNNKR